MERTLPGVVNCAYQELLHKELPLQASLRACILPCHDFQVRAGFHPLRSLSVPTIATGNGMVAWLGRIPPHLHAIAFPPGSALLMASMLLVAA